ncbi:ubiquinol-cytochrome C chaperone family protein [Marinivivus vitaminiproducens]|uniref:ubiquinol-cytochrome C chaperone family protein n=1 Tax=Marinivivus vitaminiproducens TaxID=3035935 RepID=UPI0027A7539A|nr:ubiquinol-cytochrome C chaperone family protein [Geminicoccaceae bacterium SCSIO 64248]
MTERAQAPRAGLRSLLDGMWPFRAAGGSARRQAALLYRQLVAAARQPGFYAHLGVPDTPEGRFEMVALHVMLALRRLRDGGRAEQAVAQALFDIMFADMDRALRELGIGDLSVGAYVKRMAQNLYARIADLDRPLAEADRAAVVAVLRRNAYVGGSVPDDRVIGRLADYLIAAGKRLDGLGPDLVASGSETGLTALAGTVE